ncbi:MAG: Rnase Y domain-containing protein, partial [Bacteroidales bacterium]|nr:Rnase Y domain-containing protein [Bacteroidales bacterium]
MMDTLLIAIFVGVVGIALGVLLSSTILRKRVTKKSQMLLLDAQEKAEMIKKEKILQAKEKFLQLKTEHEQVVNERNNILLKNENRLKQKETTASQKLEELNKKEKELANLRKNLTSQLEVINAKQEELDKFVNKQVAQLEAISGLTAEEAKAQIIETLKDEAKSEAMVFIQDILDEAKLTANQKAREIIVETIQRT